MIQDTAATDRLVVEQRWSKRRLAWIVPTLLAASSLALILPSAVRWLRSGRSVSLERIRLGTVTRGDILRDVSVQGRIVAASHPTISSPAAGVVFLKVRAGETVQKNQVLAVVTSPELNSRLKQERSILQGLESELGSHRIQSRQRDLTNRQTADLAAVQLEAAQRAMHRADLTKAQGILNQVEYEKAQDDLRRAELALAHARETAQLEKEILDLGVRNRELAVERQRMVVAEAERQVAELSIRAPLSGEVSRLDVEDHRAVTLGQPLVAVVDLSALEVEVMIPEGSAREIGIGTPARISAGGKQYEGTIKSVSPEVEGSQVRGIVAFSEGVPASLRQNERISTRLVLESKTSVLKVPRGPFLEGGGGSQAYVIEGGVAVLRRIRIGAASVEDVEILTGLKEGDRIIISETARFEAAERIYLRN